LGCQPGRVGGDERIRYVSEGRSDTQLVKLKGCHIVTDLQDNLMKSGGHELRGHRILRARFGDIRLGPRVRIGIGMLFNKNRDCVS